MAGKDKGKKTAKRKTKFRVPNRPVEFSEDEGFKAKAKSSSKAGTEEIEVEDLLDGLVSVFGEGLGTVLDKSSTVGAGLLSDVRSAARSAVSAAVGGVVKVCRIVEDAVGEKDPGFRDKG
ncbi:MAG: hypothetical protein IIC04_10100 [Proteobacteria bacterium]|nr:hypothetical protein [Pseudomonadota bacterium]